MDNYAKTNHLNLEDVSQVILGAAILSTPIAFSEEAWRFGETLPLMNLFSLIILSLTILFFYVFFVIFQGKALGRVGALIFRVFFDYIVTLAVVAIVLLALDRLPVQIEPLIALKRVIILSFPGSMGAVVVDGLDKE